MCSIGMYYAEKKIDFDLLHRIMEHSERRGLDAIGLSIVKNNEIYKTVKFVGSYTKNKKNVDGFLDQNLDVKDILIWNNRARPMTEVISEDESSIQPIVYEDEKIILVHNGVVANEQEFKVEKRTKIDSEIFAQLYLINGRDIKKATESVVGGSAYIVWDGKKKIVYIVKDFKPLAMAKINDSILVLSDIDGFSNILGKVNIWFNDTKNYQELKEFNIVTLDLENKKYEEQSFNPRYISSLPPRDENKVLVMASGGVDSSVSAAVAKRIYGQDVYLCHFDIGHKNNPGEQKAVEYLAKELDVPLLNFDLGWLGNLGHSVLTDKNLEIPIAERINLKSTVCWVPARNLVFASVLFAIAESIGATKIYNGWTLEESGSYPDNEVGFFKTLNEVAKYGTLVRPEVVMVEADLMKPEIIALGRHLKLDFSKLWSCDGNLQNPLEECGKCGACWLKRKAIEITDNTEVDINLILKRLRK